MKRTIKNVVMVVIMVLALGSICYTVYYAKNNIISTNVVDMEENISNEGNTPPDIPDGEVDMDSENTPGDIGGEDAPEVPDGEEMTIPGDSEEENIPEKPDSDTTEQTNQEAELTYEYYIAFGIETLILSLTLMYLIMSGFNKKNIKETFVTADKIMIYILAIIILTGGLTFIEGYLTENYFLTNSSNTNNEIPEGSLNNDTSSITYGASLEITEDTTITSGEYSSTSENENAILVNGEIDVEISDITVTKTGDADGGDDSNFYGTNSAILAKGGASLTIDNITVETDADGANGVFSYGGSATTSNTSSDGTTVTISNSTITTYGDNAGGIMTTGGGITYAYNLEITTAGTSSAAIRSDRGGGTVVVDGGTYKTTGAGSPTIYSTADITVSNATLIATSSEGIVIEGKNSVTIEDCILTDTNSKLNGESTTYKNIFLYQSMSGDADDGLSLFTAKNSAITTNKGDTFYVTNTTAKIVLENNTIINNDSDGYFLRIQADSWGNSGSNGGDVTMILTNQEASGDIYLDEISTLDLTLEDSSNYEGAINSDNTAKSITLTLDDSSTLTLTGDSYVTSLNDSDNTYSNINFNGYTLYVNGVALKQ